MHIRVGAAEGCDLLILIFKNKIKRSQPSAAPTGAGQDSAAIKPLVYSAICSKPLIPVRVRPFYTAT
jgi:hypothetical protein